MGHHVPHHPRHHLRHDLRDGLRGNSHNEAASKRTENSGEYGSPGLSVGTHRYCSIRRPVFRATASQPIGDHVCPEERNASAVQLYAAMNSRANARSKGA